MLRGVPGELVEVHRIVAFRHVIVRHVLVRLLLDEPDLFASQRAVRSIGNRPRQEVEQRPSRAHPFGCVFDPPRLEQHHVANHSVRRPPGQRVVADIGDTIRREILAADRQHPVADLRRDPRVDAVRDDVVEGAVLRADRGDVVLAQLDVGQAGSGDQRLAGPDLPVREVYAGESGARQRRCHRDQVVAVPAAKLEHPAGFDLRGIQAEQQRQRSKPRRMRLRNRQAVVRQLVVLGERARLPVGTDDAHRRPSSAVAAIVAVQQGDNRRAIRGARHAGIVFFMCRPRECEEFKASGPLREAPIHDVSQWTRCDLSPSRLAESAGGRRDHARGGRTRPAQPASRPAFARRTRFWLSFARI
jgi:hypothetical protein